MSSSFRDVETLPITALLALLVCACPPSALPPPPHRPALSPPAVQNNFQSKTEGVKEVTDDSVFGFHAGSVNKKDQNTSTYLIGQVLESPPHSWRMNTIDSERYMASSTLPNTTSNYRSLCSEGRLGIYQFEKSNRYHVANLNCKMIKNLPDSESSRCSPSAGIEIRVDVTPDVTDFNNFQWVQVVTTNHSGEDSEFGSTIQFVDDKNICTHIYDKETGTALERLKDPRDGDVQRYRRICDKIKSMLLSKSEKKRYCIVPYSNSAPPQEQPIGRFYDNPIRDLGCPHRSNESCQVRGRQKVTWEAVLGLFGLRETERRPDSTNSRALLTNIYYGFEINYDVVPFHFKSARGECFTMNKIAPSKALREYGPYAVVRQGPAGQVSRFSRALKEFEEKWDKYLCYKNE